MEMVLLILCEGQIETRLCVQIVCSGKEWLVDIGLLSVLEYVQCVLDQ